MESRTKQPLLFFFDDFHRGPVNVILHCAGFAILGYAIGTNQFSLVFVSTAVMEAGHFYNALRGGGGLRDYALWAIPFQYFVWLIIVLTAYSLGKFIGL